VSSSSPLISVVIPVYNGAKVLPRCLAALEASDLPRSSWELVLVDDGSTDESVSIAAGVADVVVRLPGPPRGPGYARNRGFESSIGAIVAFVDADVCVHPDCLRRMLWSFAEASDVGAVFGSYDSNPAAPDLISQYRNLLHHYVHQRNAGEAETFWAGCGAVRREVFHEAGRYDEWHFPRPQIEDIELGHRIREAGHRILLRPEIQCTHLKRWTLKGVVLTDVRDRGVPWMRLLLQQGTGAHSRVLNLRAMEKVNTALGGLALLSLALAVVFRRWMWLWAVVVWLVTVMVSNRELYGFFVRMRGIGFAIGVLPLHLLYYLLNGFSALWGWALHHLIGAPAPAADIQAFSEVGVQTWPPLPAKAKDSVWVRPGSSRSED
jgi:glycosyltransferase involved in cell wall biosynthesis